MSDEIVEKPKTVKLKNVGDVPCTIEMHGAPSSRAAAPVKAATVEPGKTIEVPVGLADVFCRMHEKRLVLADSAAAAAPTKAPEGGGEDPGKEDKGKKGAKK